MSIAAESRAKSPRDAQRANADAMTAVLGRLKGAGLPADAVRTSGYDLQPEFDYTNGKQVLRGYIARNSIEVRVDNIARVGEMPDLAVGSGATSVSGVRFDLKDRTSAEREALKRASPTPRREAKPRPRRGRHDRPCRADEEQGLSCRTWSRDDAAASDGGVCHGLPAAHYGG